MRRAQGSFPIAVAAAATVVAFLVCVVSPAVEAQALGPNLVDVGSIPTSSRLVFRNERGLHGYYAFFYNPSLGWAYRYSSDGLFWSPRQAVFSGGFGSAGVWVHDSGTTSIVHFVASGAPYGSILYRRGTVADSGLPITWDSTPQVVEPGGPNAGTFGLGVTRTVTGRPIITAVAEVVRGRGYIYEVRAWGANSDMSFPTWTRVTLMPGLVLPWSNSVGFTSAYPAGGDYVFVAASAASALKDQQKPFDVRWVRASWNGLTWTVGFVTFLAAFYPNARPVSLVVDDMQHPHALVLFPVGITASPTLVHYRGASLDGKTFETFSVSSSAVSSATLSINFLTSVPTLRATYHFGPSNIYWKESLAYPVQWGPENTISWSEDTTNLTSSQRDQMGTIHSLAESVNGVYYFS